MTKRKDSTVFPKRIYYSITFSFTRFEILLMLTLNRHTKFLFFFPWFFGKHLYWQYYFLHKLGWQYCQFEQWSCQLHDSKILGFSHVLDSKWRWGGFTKVIYGRPLMLPGFQFFNLFTHYWWHGSDTSMKMVSEGGETGRSISYLSTNMPNAFSFKIQDKKGRLHRFTCGMSTIMW